MLIKNLFERDIFRPINGVVKADQLDDSSVWQELDEFVITRELDQHFRKFISWYLEAVDQGEEPRRRREDGRLDFGLLRLRQVALSQGVLSYLLRNRTHTHNGQSKRAVEFFESKVVLLQTEWEKRTARISYNLERRFTHVQEEAETPQCPGEGRDPSASSPRTHPRFGPL